MAIEMQDLHRLRDEPSSATRTQIAEKIASAFAASGFSSQDERIAIEIFRLLVSDAETQVRRMLSQHLARSMNVPHDIILALAHDIPEISLNVLENSYVLTEEDLIAITQSTHDVPVMTAIARREMVSRELSQALLEKSNLAVVETLLRNKSANLDDHALERILEDCGEHHSVMELLVKRGGLPMTLAEKLFVAVSDEFKRILTQQYKLSLQMADDSTKDARELVTLGLVGNETRTMDIARLVDQLYQQGRLTLSIIIRSLCLGDMRFFEHAMAKLADVPITNVQLLVLDQGVHGFESLYKTSCLPMELYAATRHLVTVALEETNFGQFQRNDFRKRLADRLMQDEAARKIEYMDYLVTLIQHNARDAVSAA